MDSESGAVSYRPVATSSMDDASRSSNNIGNSNRYSINNSSNSNNNDDEPLSNDTTTVKRTGLSGLEEILEKQGTIFDDSPHGLGLEGFAARLYDRGIGGKLLWCGMCMGGFCSPFRCCRTLYLTLWACAFVLCGGSCFWNLVKREVPYHLFPVDLMMALVHIPGLFSQLFWHSAFRGNEGVIDDIPLRRNIHPGNEMWQVNTFVKAYDNLCLRSGDQLSGEQGGSDTVRAHTDAFISFAGAVLIPAQMGMTALVYYGYVMPACRGHVGGFAETHSWIMVFAIPPVVSCLVTSGAMVAYFIYLHMLEAEIISVLLQSSARHEIKNLQAHGKLNRIIKWGENNIYVGNADIESERYANTVVSYMVEIFMHVQDRVDTSCKVWSSVVTQFIVIAFLEILAAAWDFSLIFEGRLTYDMPRAVFCVDIFLLASGLIAISTLLCMGGSLTQRMDDLVVDVIVGLRARGVPPAISFSLFRFLETAGRKDGIGFKIFRVRITSSHVITFFSVMSTVLAYGIAHADYVLESGQ